MLGELDPMDYILAEKLGKTLGEIRAMPARDFIEWGAFYKYRDAMSDLHARS